MAKIPKFIKINSLNPDDVAEMFDFICTDVVDTTPLKAKKEVLKLEGSAKDLNEVQPDIISLLTLIAHYNLKCEIKVTYGGDPEPLPKVEPPEPEAVKGAMEKQEQEIEKFPEYIGGVKVEIVEVVNSQRVDHQRNESEIPDFD